MYKKVLLIFCMAFSIIHGELKTYNVFFYALAVTTIAQTSAILKYVKFQNTQRMICDHKLKAVGYCALQSVLLYGFSHTLVNFVNSKNCNM